MRMRKRENRKENVTSFKGITRNTKKKKKKTKKKKNKNKNKNKKALNEQIQQQRDKHNRSPARFVFFLYVSYQTH